MIKNYIKVAWRNLVKNKLYSIINIGGLSAGMAISFILLLYVYNEFNFDKFNVNHNRLYSVLRNKPSNGELKTNSSTPAPLAGVLQKDFPEIDKVARIKLPGNVLINYKDKGIKLNTLAADPALLDMFSFDFIYGSKSNALAGPGGIILTQSAVKAIFGDINPVGLVVKLDNQYLLKVSAVIKDNPQNSSLQFKVLISWQTVEAEQQWIKKSGWSNYSFLTYVMLKQEAPVTSLNAKLKTIIARYDPQNKDNTLFLYPLTRLHLYSDFKDGVNVGGSIEYVRLFLLLAIGILIIACINFMNLATARSAHRAMEVGVRKAIGAQRAALIQQFMAESLLMAFMAFILSLVLVLVLLPFFNTIINIQLALPYGNLWAWISALGVTLFTGLAAGSYPAIFLSSFKPVKVLKDRLTSAKATVRPRQVLVMIQFTFAVCLILSSIFIYKQINYIKNRPVGYSRDGLIEMPVEGALLTRFESFRQDAINSGAIIDGAVSSGSITNNGSYSWGITWPGQLPGEDQIPIDQIAVTYHFISTYGLVLSQGRDLNRAYPADSTGLILNEAAVKLMRFKDPLGQVVKWQDKEHTVVGVVKDFVWGSPYAPVKPAIMGFKKDWKGGVGLRLNPNMPVSKSLELVQQAYKKYNPGYPFEYTFTDDLFNQKFATEKLLGTMAIGFTCLAIIISCLGLFGLAAFSAEQRRKEISIHRVLGATIADIWFKLSQEFVKLVLISFIAGSLICWYIMPQWLSKYTYHTALSIWVFIATLFITLAICLLTVSWQAIRVAVDNPVKSLRSE